VEVEAAVVEHQPEAPLSHEVSLGERFFGDEKWIK
jgi:hypothetical protein